MNIRRILIITMIVYIIKIKSLFYIQKVIVGSNIAFIYKIISNVIKMVYLSAITMCI